MAQAKNSRSPVVVSFVLDDGVPGQNLPKTFDSKRMRYQGSRQSMCCSLSSTHDMENADLDKSADSDSAVWLDMRSGSRPSFDLCRKAKSSEALDTKHSTKQWSGIARSGRRKEHSLESKLLCIGNTLAFPILNVGKMQCSNDVKPPESYMKAKETHNHRLGIYFTSNCFHQRRFSRSLSDVTMGLSSAAGFAQQFSQALAGFRRRSCIVGSLDSDASPCFSDAAGLFKELPSSAMTAMDDDWTTKRVKSSSMSNLTAYRTSENRGEFKKQLTADSGTSSADVSRPTVYKMPPKCSQPLHSKRNPSLGDIKTCGWYNSDSLQSKSSSEYADLPPHFSGEFSDFHDISDSNDEVELSTAGRHYGAHALLKPTDSGGTTYSNSSRKSSATSDSAIDLHTGTEDTSGDVSPVPNPIHPYLLLGNTERDLKLAEFSRQFESDSGMENVNEEAVTRLKRSFVDSSFTRLPPSVIISDHSQEDQRVSPVHLGAHQGAELQYLGIFDALENIDQDSLERKSSMSSIASDSSSRSFMSDSPSLSVDEDDYQYLNAPHSKESVSKSSWRKIRNMVHWSPFIQQFKKNRYPWVQLAGHHGNFRAGEQGTILKKLCPKEKTCLQELMLDILRPYVPEYKADVDHEGEKYIQMQDLLCEFDSPSVMDCKIGTRTYLEEELMKARKTPQLRADMYKKMVEVDANEPTDEEHAQKAITKPRYMIWRETISSTSSLGFRIEGIKKQETQSTQFKTTKTRQQVKEALVFFTDKARQVLNKYLRRLKAIRATVEISPFFAEHEVIGSSLLFVHDARGNASIWMIDFGKTTRLPDGMRLNHRTPWQEGNKEDGYLFGIDNMITVLEDLYEESLGECGGQMSDSEQP